PSAVRLARARSRQQLTTIFALATCRADREPRLVGLRLDNSVPSQPALVHRPVLHQEQPRNAPSPFARIPGCEENRPARAGFARIADRAAPLERDRREPCPLAAA